MPLNVGRLVATIDVDDRGFRRGVRDDQRQLRGFTTDASGRLHDMRGRFVSASEAARRLGDETESGSRRGRGGLSGLFGALGSVVGALGKAAPSAAALGGTMQGLGYTTGVVAAPAISALVPILASAGVGAVTAKLAFKGVGEAVKASGEGSKKYAEALKKLSGPQRDFVKEVVATKKEFSGLGKEIQKIVLPSFTRALKGADPAISAVKSGVKDMAHVFAEFGDEFGKLFGSKKFAADLRDNFQLGSGFFKSLAAPMADFTRGFVRMGAASKPALDALSKGIGGLLGKGLPGLFDGLSIGIGGAAKMFNGLFDAINRILPALGEFIGRAADALGPALGQIFADAGKNGAGAFRTLGAAMTALKPVFMEIAGGVRIVGTVLRSIGSIAKDVGMVLLESLWPSFRKADDARGPLQRLADWLETNKVQVMEFANQAATSIINFVITVVQALPDVIRGFRGMATGVLDAFSGISAGAVAAFGWMPGIGPKVKAANREFNSFKANFLHALDEAAAGAASFSASVTPRLERNKLKMNIQNWTSQIATAKAQMKSVPPEKRSALKAQIADLEAKVKRARALLASVKSKTVSVTTVFKTVRKAGGSNQAAKNYYMTNRARGGPVPGYAAGGHVRALQAYPSGGLVRGPGSSMSDSILGLFRSGTARVSDREYVVRAAAVRKYGVNLFDELNSMQLKTTALAAGRGASYAPHPASTPAPRPAASGSTYNNTYHLYQRDMTLQGLKLLQRQQDAEARVGRPH